MTGLSKLGKPAFPIKQASLDSVHETNMRYGHISQIGGG